MEPKGSPALEPRASPAKKCCSQCGKDRNGSVLGEAACDCKSETASIRLGPVPESAFRPPSPRPSSKAEGRDEVPLPVTTGAGSSKYEIISIREKHGEFRKAIPCMPLAVAIFCCLLNAVIPGTGTLIAGLTVLCGCRTEHETKRRSLGYNMVAALLQILTAPIIVGWIWSVLWGITFVNVSVTKALQEPPDASAV